MLRRLLPSIRFALAGTCAAASHAAPLEFNRDVRPILSENCFQCHGQDAAKREGKLRLDDRESATRLHDGYAAILPGKPDESEMIRRIASTASDEVMPPPESHKTVSPAQAAVLRQWIAEGAPFQKHWAFLPPRQAPLPAVRNATWPRAALDRLVLARLEREGLAPSTAATAETWLRRASFDLTGLPPTSGELDVFAADVTRRGEAAFEAAVDRLLASPHYGERQAIEWLDAARYADTHGFNNDSSRTMWRWRDWVIEAFNANVPYDRFITEQIAGDLLPQPSLEQRIATGFARNHVISSEGGIIGEEYRVEYVADRVRTLSTAWLGLTMECAKCHDHKFDPITQRDYFRLFAFFNNVPEHGEDGRVANAIPMIPAPTREQQTALAAQQRELAALDQHLQAARAGWKWNDAAAARVAAWMAETRPAANAFDPAKPDAVATAESGVALIAEKDRLGVDGTASATWRSDPALPPPKVPAAALDFAGKSGVTLTAWLKPAADGPRDAVILSSLNHVGSTEDSQFGKGRELRLVDGELELRLSERYPVYAIVLRTVGAAIAPGAWRHVAVSYAGGKRAAAVRIFVDGTEVATRVLYDGLPGEPPKREFLIGADNTPDGARWRGEIDDLRGFARVLDAPAIQREFRAGALGRAVPRVERGKASALEQGWVRDAVLADASATRELVASRDALWAQHLALQRSLPTAMVMEEMPAPRPAFVLQRGQYDAPGERVEPGVPETLIAPWPAGAPRNRLGLARWLTQPQHPLTARVVVNRWWAQLFGTGLVKTLEDFGSQSEWPSHPELLDWLARDFVDGGWNVKALLRTLVLSATYRQDSAVTPALVARDPENRLLARGPRVRLPAELIRDQALAVSGLLAPRIGGPSVHSYQPEKLYEGIVVGAEYPGTKWPTGSGEDLYRRSLYTFWKRTVPHPAMIAFDAPDREFCTVRRSRTNTPLQALALWNEPGYFEAARHLGQRLLREGGQEDGARLAWAFRQATGRRPTADEARVLVNALQRLRTDFEAHPEDAERLLTVGASPAAAGFAPTELAAAASVASMILSLDETITKR
ncbi:DUF1553 domain-containing protein [Horticoccus sp. 23ND18S-11]|uniref:DUF1553 domain-containing protein n=1 Tax=Horticoccus sp. 23ND18S-11 TaxID=3391832 RepID=UPI0039C9A51D